MTAAVLVRRRPGSGLRPVNPRRDLVGLADLIVAAFAGSLDAPGRQMAREMRWYGRLGWFGWLIGHLALPPAAYPKGYVWIESGRLVGNASLLPVEGAASRWVLANVAVHPDFRRRGIARAMVEACLQLGRRGAAREIVLQVKAGNEGARLLYRSFGFGERCTWVTWRSTARVSPSEWAVAARPRRPGEWEAHWAMVKRLYPLGLVWPHPLRPGMFRTSGWPGGDAWSHWAWPREGAIAAALSARGEPGGVTHLFLASTPEARRRAEVPLVTAALEGVGGHGAITLLETDAEAPAAELRAMGFVEEHRLAWMSLDLGVGGAVAQP